MNALYQIEEASFLLVFAVIFLIKNGIWVSPNAFFVSIEMIT